MIFYGDFTTAKGLPATPRIDFIEVEFNGSIDPKFVPEDLEASPGIRLSCDWDESDWTYDENTGEGSFRCKGVYINQIYANGAGKMFEEAAVSEVQIYLPEASKDTQIDFSMTAFDVFDGDDAQYSVKCDAVNWHAEYD